ncbi:MAG: hypothetical protein NC319_02340 [Butyricicoccus sp.]|nr:hypothetical protein [Butyricicoccus sp.]
MTFFEVQPDKSGFAEGKVFAMKIAKTILSVITIIFTGLGLFKVLSSDISNPIMYTSLATFLVLQSIEYKNTVGKSKSDFILTFIAALFVYAVVFYNVFIG